MAARKSAGILLYNIDEGIVKFFLVHPGGPFWAKKDDGAWSIAKGEFENEEPLSAAIREFAEETGFVPKGEFVPLTPQKQKSGKIVYAWALQAYVDPSSIKSNFFEMEWPPRSGEKKEFPEIDKAAWFTTGEALKKILPGQASFINEVVHYLET